MQLPLQISAQGLTLDAEARQLIQREAAGLDHFYDGIIATRIVITVPAHQRAGREPASYLVRVDLTVVGGELAVNRQGDPTLPQAIREAFAAARARLQDYAREQRQDVKRHEPSAEGCITHLFSDAGYGVIETTDGREIHFERNSVPNEGFGRLTEGMDVRFVEVPGREGPQASTVVPIHPRHQTRAR
jgi:cold shock CspA family protein